MFISCQSEQKPPNKGENTSTIVESTATEKSVAKFRFEGCFQLEEAKGDTTTVTFVSIEIEGNEVFGEEAIEITSPEYNAIVVGSLEGVISGKVIKVQYEYSIEGAKHSEEQEFLLQDTMLIMNSQLSKEGSDLMVLIKKGEFKKGLPKMECN